VTIFDLFFLVSAALVLVLCGWMAVEAARREWSSLGRAARVLGIFVGCYALALTVAGMAAPRRIFPPGEVRCFDDWCAAAVGVKAAGGAEQGGRTWILTVEVSSRAKRVRQRERDVGVELEDRDGKRYQASGAPLANGADGVRWMTDALGPGEAFRVLLPFRLPPGASPAGAVIRHGWFPGALIIGGDGGLWRAPALLRVAY
jgi:hypothetical protein